MFNALLVLLPLLAANVVSGVFAAREFPAAPRAAALEATRAEIRLAFETLADGQDDRRAYWAGLVDGQLRARNMAAANGFLLAAPQLLDGRDREAVLQAAPTAVPFGSEDEQLLGAALLFLPNDVRVRYENAVRPRSLNLAQGTSAPTGPEEPAQAGAAPAADPAPETGETRLARRAGEPAGAFIVLGNYYDLARNSRDWLLEPADAGLELRLTGLGLIGGDLTETGGIDLVQAVSLLKSAERAGRLQPSFRERILAEVDQAMPVSTLRTRLAEAIDPRRTTDEQAEAVEAALRETLNAGQLTPLLADARQINEIVDAAGAQPALALLQHVRTETDLRKARLIAEAGGERAVALETLLGRDVLYTARTGVELSRATVMEIMGLAGVAMGLLWLLWVAARRALYPPRGIPSYD